MKYKRKEFVLWECCFCKSRGRTQKGYNIVCDGDRCFTKSFKILDIIEVFAKE